MGTRSSSRLKLPLFRKYVNFHHEFFLGQSIVTDFEVSILLIYIHHFATKVFFANLATFNKGEGGKVYFEPHLKSVHAQPCSRTPLFHFRSSTKKYGLFSIFSQSSINFPFRRNQSAVANKIDCEVLNLVLLVVINKLTGFFRKL